MPPPYHLVGILSDQQGWGKSAVSVWELTRPSGHQMRVGRAAARIAVAPNDERREMPVGTQSDAGNGSRVFLGWFVAIAAGSILAVAYGAQFSFGVMLPHMEESTQWSRGQLAGAYSMYVFVYSGLSYPAGRLTDRFGPQRVILLGGLFLSLGYLGVALSTQLWQFYFALGCVAAIGMSATFVPCNSTVVRWFAVHRGAATSISTSGVGIGGLVAPPVAGVCAVMFGWRPTYVALAIFVGLWLSIVSRAMFASPESRGLHLDGRTPVADQTDMAENPTSVSAITIARGVHDDLAVKAALRTADFWLILSIFTLTYLVVFFPIVHLAAFGESIGMSRSAASWALGAIGFGSLAGRALSGVVSDYLGRLATLGVLLGMQVVAFAVFSVTSESWMLLATAAMFGAGYGGSTAVFPAVVGDTFGRTHIGSLVGVIFAISGGLSAISPTYAGYLYTSSGSYRSSFVISSVVNALALVLVVLLGLRRHRRVPGRRS